MELVDLGVAQSAMIPQQGTSAPFADFRPEWEMIVHSDDGHAMQNDREWLWMEPEELSVLVGR